jgi:hypothetical protein
MPTLLRERGVTRMTLRVHFVNGRVLTLRVRMFTCYAGAMQGFGKPELIVHFESGGQENYPLEDISHFSATE